MDFKSSFDAWITSSVTGKMEGNEGVIPTVLSMKFSHAIFLLYCYSIVIYSLYSKEFGMMIKNLSLIKMDIQQ
jgi:hypothetical protein